MDWKQYEIAVLKEIASLYPTAKISFDSKLVGESSRIKRQCDIVVDEQAAGKCVRTLIDAKYRKRKIDVKVVEEFIGLLRDVGCERGIIVAANGFSSAAENLAFFGDKDVDLDILNFGDLQEFQGIAAIPYCDDLGLLLRSPLGWVTHAMASKEMIAAFYQRGLTLEQATRNREFMYLNFWHLNDHESLDDLIRLQEANLREFYSNGFGINYSSLNCDRNGELKLREVDVIGVDRFEITGFLTIDRCVVYGVLHSPKVKSKKNRWKLIHMLALALPINIEVKNR